MMKMMMRCWTFVVMDKDQNIRSQYDEKNIVNCCPGTKYGNLKKWTTKKILKSQYRLSSISIYIYKKYTPYVDKVSSTIWPGEEIIYITIQYILHAMIFDLMFATSIIRAWKTIPKNI